MNENGNLEPLSKYFFISLPSPLKVFSWKDVIKSICDNSHYEEVNVNKRINILIDLYQESLSRISSTVPYVSYKQGEYEVNTYGNSFSSTI